MSGMMVSRMIVTSRMATAAGMVVEMAHPGDRSLHRAIEKAEVRLISRPWRLDGGILAIASYSQDNEVHQTDGVGCSCKTTRGICWHKGAYAILATLSASGAHPEANLPLPAILDADDLPTSFLDGDFDAFEDTSLLIPARSFAEVQAAADELFA